MASMVHTAPSTTIPRNDTGSDDSPSYDPIFDRFDIFEETFKTVGSHNIKAAFILPKGLEPGTHPVILNIHGGFLVTADSLFAPFFPLWALDLAVEKSAIIVSADHRLLPSANGLPDALEDAEDFWQWTRTKLSSVLEQRVPGQEIDLSQLILNGGSAGGYLATQVALSHPDEISVLAITYPMLAMKDHLYTTGPLKGEPNILRFPDEQILPKDEVVSWIEEARAKITTKAGYERIPYIVGAAHGGVFYNLILDNKNLASLEFFPLARLEAGARLPSKVWLMHGDDDASVHIRGSNRLAAIITDQLPNTDLRYDVAIGQDHGFDSNMDNWASFRDEALDFVVAGWLSE